ncbi:MAG: BON domain-containing protein [Ferruginibacter sp.]
MKITKVLMAVAIVTTTGFLSCKPKDADIKSAVEAKLNAKPDMSGTMVSVTDGVATISGECKDETCKADCEKLTSEVKGVKSVVNNLTVPPPPPPPVAVTVDDTLKSGVNDALKDFTTVTAEVIDGVVTLTGTIKKTELPKVMMALSSLKPKKIENKLTVK